LSEDGFPPQLWVVAGPNGAGKSTLIRRGIGERLTIIDPDAIAAALPRINGALDERQAGVIALQRRRTLLEERSSFLIETTLTGNSALRLMQSAKAAGFKITLVYVGLATTDLSAQRVADRVAQGGHDIPKEAIERRLAASLGNLTPASALADRFYLFDNSSLRRRLLLIGEDERTRWRADLIPDWLGTYISEKWRVSR